MTIYHLTRKTGSKKYTAAMYLPKGNECEAEVESVFRLNDVDVTGAMIETEAVCNQKIWKGYTEECPVFYWDKPTREYLQNNGYNERDSAYRDYQRGDMTERDYLDFCSQSYKRQDEAGRTDEHKATYQPAEYPMIEGEGAPQYTFALPTEPTQLALL